MLLARSAPEGKPDEIGAKADVGIECSLLWGKRTYRRHGRGVRC